MVKFSLILLPLCQKKLTTLQLIKTASHMTSSTDLHLLAAHLGVEYHLVEGELDSSKSTVDAARKVLFNWRRTVETAERAYELLRAELIECGNKQAVAEVLDA